LQPSSHFTFGTHPQHGLVAAALSPAVPAHLARRLLTREQFEPVPGTPGLFRLTEPERDGPRRARRAIHGLRRAGYTVHADYSLATTSEPAGPQPTRTERRSRLARAAALRSPQRRTPPTTSLPLVRPIPPLPAYAPTVHLTPGRPR
jgi:hypothetical protein